jgi:hypothetical protein
MTAETEAASTRNQWLRQIRRDTYAEFIAAVDPSGRFWQDVENATYGDQSQASATIGELFGRIDIELIHQRNARVGLEASGALAQIAQVIVHEIEGALHRWRSPLNEQLTPDVRVTWDVKMTMLRNRVEGVKQEVSRFTAEARQSLTEGL